MGINSRLTEVQNPKFGLAPAWENSEKFWKSFWENDRARTNHVVLSLLDVEYGFHRPGLAMQRGKRQGPMEYRPPVGSEGEELHWKIGLLSEEEIEKMEK